MNPSISPPESNPRKRRRPALSCEQCRRRKVRCDREMPCGPCSKAHPELECEYVYEGKAALDARLDVSHGHDERASPSRDASRIAQLERTVHALQGRLQGLEQVLQVDGESGLPTRNASDTTHVNLARAPHRLDHRPTEERQSEQPQTLISPLAPRLKGSGDRTKLFGTTHWALVFQQVCTFPLMG